MLWFLTLFCLPKNERKEKKKHIPKITTFNVILPPNTELSKALWGLAV
jgi:hypothetical protein